ncbi:hypothetical protein EPUL_006347, partial [Erysiphe pulchra]
EKSINEKARVKKPDENSKVEKSLNERVIVKIPIDKTNVKMTNKIVGVKSSSKEITKVKPDNVVKNEEKQGCWSTRHSDAERSKAKAKYREQFGKAGESRFDQFLVDFEGHDENNRSDKIESMIVCIEDINFMDDECFITDAGKLNGNDVSIIISKLYNRSTTHALLKDLDEIDDIVTVENMPPTITQSRYGPDIFHSVMIDTGAA